MEELLAWERPLDPSPIPQPPPQPKLPQPIPPQARPHQPIPPQARPHQARLPQLTLQANLQVLAEPTQFQPKIQF